MTHPDTDITAGGPALLSMHQFSNDTLGISHQGRLLARNDSAGQLLYDVHNERAATPQRWASQKMPAGTPPAQLPARIQIPHFSARAPNRSERTSEKKSLTRPLQPQTAERPMPYRNPYSPT